MCCRKITASISFRARILEKDNRYSLLIAGKQDAKKEYA